MAFSFQQVGQAELEMGEMPNPVALALCHASGKITGTMTQEIQFFPSGDSVVSTLTGEKRERRGGGGSDFPYE